MAQRRAAAAAANDSDSDYVGSETEYNTDDLYDVVDDVAVEEDDDEEERALVLAESSELTYLEGRESRMVVYDEEFNKLLKEAVDVERNKIGENTRKQYNKANVNFVKWLVYYCPLTLKLEYRDLFKEHYNGGQDVGLTEIVTKVVAEEEKCPVDLRKFEARIFFTYLLSYKKVDGTFFSYSCYDSKKSAFMWMVTNSKSVMSVLEKQELSNLMVSLKKTIQKERRDLSLKTTEGKDIMNWKTYQYLCEVLTDEGTKEAIFVLCWLTLQWNLMSRSEATEAICFRQLKWEADHLKIYFPRHKSDPKGEEREIPRHVYSNPLIPAVCPLRALSSYLMVFPDILNEGVRVFPGGDDQKKRFNRLFNECLERNSEDFMTKLGVDYTEIGTHSIRKGAATYCCSGVHPGPPIVSVCLRAGWSLGRVKERYLKYEPCGDEIVGRTLTGIPPTCGEFTTSPVYFNSKTNIHFIKQLCSLIYPNPHSQMPLIEAMLASFIYHESWTTEKYGEGSPMRNIAYWSIASTVPNRREFVQTSLPWNREEECPNFTGIPLHSTLLNKLIEIHELQITLPTDMMNKIKEELDRRCIGSASAVLESRVMSKFDEWTDKLDKKFDEKFKGQERLATTEGNMFDLTTNNPDARLTSDSTKSAPSLLFPSEGVWAHYWDDKVRHVPRDFNFPHHYSMFSLWQSWHIPDFARKVCPWKYLENSDLEHIQRGKSKYNEMKLVIGEMLHVIHQDEKMKQDYEIGNKNLTVLTQIFDKVKYIYQTNKARRLRFSQISWESVVKDARNLRHDRMNPGAEKKYKTDYTPPSTTKKRRGRPPKNTTTQPRRRRAPYKRRQPKRGQAREQPTESTNNEQKEPEGSRELPRNPAGYFEPVTCSYCKKLPTQHRCLFSKQGGLIDLKDNKEICGRPFCSDCAYHVWGQEMGNRCHEHRHT